MKFTIETFGNKIKVATSAGEVAYLGVTPVSGQVVRVKGSNGPVYRRITSLSNNVGQMN